MIFSACEQTSSGRVEDSGVAARQVDHVWPSRNAVHGDHGVTCADGGVIVAPHVAAANASKAPHKRGW